MSYLLTNFLPQELVDKIDGIAHDLEQADIATARQEWQNSLATVNSDFKDSLVFNVLEECQRGTIEVQAPVAIDYEQLNMLGVYDSYLLDQLDEMYYDLESEFYFEHLREYKSWIKGTYDFYGGFDE